MRKIRQNVESSRKVLALEQKTFSSFSANEKVFHKFKCVLVGKVRFSYVFREYDFFDEKSIYKA